MNQISLLYWSSEYTERTWITQMHSHAHWQLEIVFKGQIEIHFSRKKILLPAGRMILIPPNKVHRIHYKGLRSVLSLKFHLQNHSEEFNYTCLPNTEIINFIANLFKTFLSKKTSSLTETNKTYIEFQLSYLIKEFYTEKDIIEKSEIQEIIDKKLEENPECNLLVKDLANELNISTCYLSKTFKDNVGTTLKNYLDQKRILIAQRNLMYSDLNVSEIADLMGFKTAFEFSRFYKNKTGKSPLHFKQSLHKKREGKQ